DGPDGPATGTSQRSAGEGRRPLAPAGHGRRWIAGAEGGLPDETRGTSSALLGLFTEGTARERRGDSRRPGEALAECPVSVRPDPRQAWAEGVDVRVGPGCRLERGVAEGDEHGPAAAAGRAAARRGLADECEAGNPASRRAGEGLRMIAITRRCRRGCAQ